MIGLSVLTLLLAGDGSIGRLDGAVLFAGAVAYSAFQIRQSRRESAAIRDEYAQEYGPKRSSTAANLAMIGAGLALPCSARGGW
jgi:cation:H+ antiporter